ncbi:MAG: hypothetical protein FWE23_00225 [Chitinivibrionia bacterium]|nr:hypothetical protein [Chitinivibrionia bacterium]
MKIVFWILMVMFAFSAQIFSQPCFPPFEPNRDYFTGSQVSHNGRNFVANWSTREVPGVQNWGGWRALGQCQEEIIIDLSTPQERQAAQSISQFLLFATENLLLNSGITIVGNIGANGSVSVGDIAAGWKTMVNGDIYSKHAVSTTAEAVINGNIFAKSLQLGWQAKHNGALIIDHEFDFNVATKTISTSSQNVAGAWQRRVVLAPGTYGNVSVSDGGALELSSGVYNLRSLSLNSADIPIYLNIAAGESIQLNVQDNLQFGSGTKINFSGNTAPMSFRIHTNQTHDLIIHDHSEINAIITAPNARVVVNNNTIVNGAIFAREIEVINGAVINSVPYITDIFHSEYHFAPAFDILTNDYFSMIDINSTIEFVRVNALDNFRITETNNGFKHLFAIEDTVSNLVSYYTIEFERSFNPAVFVNGNASAGGDGLTWDRAVRTLKEAVEIAQITGRRIQVVEGTYDGVEIGQGTKIIGGFLGGEIDGEPTGSPYNTIITGRNKSRALTINGFAGAKSVKIKGITIQDGVSVKNGAGIFSPNVIPKFEELIVKNNFTAESGAGIYAPRGIQDMHMVLVENNSGRNAFYIGGASTSSRETRAERVIISTNSGDGLLLQNTGISFINSIFYGNYTAIIAENSRLDLLHCTFVKNLTGVYSEQNSRVRIINTILWNDGRELEGDGFDVSFSAVRGGFAGEGNIDDDPLFVNVDNPKGGDGFWLGLNNGLSLKTNSPAIDAGKEMLDILYDFIETSRPLENGFDMGAFEVPVFKDGDQTVDFGILTSNNEFIRGEGIGDIMVGLTRRDLHRKIFTRSALTLRVFVEKNKHTDIESRTARVVFRDENGRDVGRGIDVQFFRNRALETSSHRAFTSRRVVDGRVVGPVIFMVAGDVDAHPGDPFRVLKVADNISSDQEYISGTIHVVITY